ncbi:MAG: hypothetical protein ACR2J6_05545, partial [Thermoleophilaceae bacterium]
MSRLVRSVLLSWGLVRGLLRAPRAGEDEGGAGVAPDWGPDSADADADPTRRETGAPPWAELTLVGLLLGAGVLFAAFAVLVAAEPDTQLLGLTAGGGLTLVAAALILAGKRVTPRETAVEERPQLVDPKAERELESEAGSGTDGVSRRRLIVAAAGAAGTGLDEAAALPITALRPGPSALPGPPCRAPPPLL